MTKIVTCAKCKREFEVVRVLGGLKEVAQGVRCPYEGCFHMNSVDWPIDGTFYSVEILKAIAAHR
jgi:hypothetical protein